LRTVAGALANCWGGRRRHHALGDGGRPFFRAAPSAMQDCHSNAASAHCDKRQFQLLRGVRQRNHQVRLRGVGSWKTLLPGIKYSHIVVNLGVHGPPLRDCGKPGCMEVSSRSVSCSYLAGALRAHLLGGAPCAAPAWHLNTGCSCVRKNTPKRLATAGPGVGGVGEGVGSRCGCVKVWACEECMSLLSLCNGMFWFIAWALDRAAQRHQHTAG
jgi:hypothetical protein